MDRNGIIAAALALGYKRSPPARVAWIETGRLTRTNRCGQSPPARVAWIETGCAARQCTAHHVATREGGVDRNAKVDDTLSGVPGVATREGGVDRNIQCFNATNKLLMSPPARVAWIETLLRWLLLRYL